MNNLSHALKLPWILAVLLANLLWIGGQLAHAASPVEGSAAALRAKYTALGTKLRENQFKRPIHLDSAEYSNRVHGDVYALVNHPFSSVTAALNSPSNWCEVLMLHINTKSCNAPGSVLSTVIGKNIHQPMEEAYRIELAYRTAVKTPEYFDVRLNANSGPLGTSDYRIRLEAVSLEGGKTFLHLTYSYAFDYVTQIAMQAYLATVASNKVGFTITGSKSDGSPIYVGGMRGLVERNIMRYYLAVDGYLEARSLPADRQLEQRLQNWFSSTELYRRQLHEVDRATYLSIKRKEHSRLQKTS